MARKPSSDNPPCPHCGAAYVVKNGSKDGRPRWVCRVCRHSFGPTWGTPMCRLRATPTEVARTLLVVMRRGSLSAAEEITGHKYETIGRWLRAAAKQAEVITAVLVHDLHLTAVEVDAFWSFVKKKQSAPEAAISPAEGVGPRWGCLSLDRPTRFVIAWAFAASEDEAAPAVVRPTRQRTRGQAGVPWIRDGQAIYRQEVSHVYRDPQRTGKRGRPPLVPTPGVGLSQAVKQRCHGRVVGVEVRQVLGPPIACPYAVHSERLNGVLRDRLNCLTRKTHAFAKDERTWDAAVTLCLFETNWLRPHPALRELADNLPQGRRYRQRTPAMAIGLTDHIWSWEDFLTVRHYHYSKE